MASSRTETIALFELPRGLKKNAYKNDLPGDYNVSGTFNIFDLIPYHEEKVSNPGKS